MFRRTSSIRARSTSATRLRRAAAPFIPAWLIAALFVALAGPASAQLPGTLFGQVFDENGEPLTGVTIVVTDPEAANFRQEIESGRNGRYTLHVTNSLPSYTLTFSKEGYQEFTMGGVKITARQRTRRNFEMKSVEAALASAVESGDIDEDALTKGGAVQLYNKGANAYNSGDMLAAEEAFRAAIEKDAENAGAWAGLARVYRRNEDPMSALEAADKALALGETDTANMNQIRYDAYLAMGETDKANEILAELEAGDPEKAAKNLFNQAADLFNQGDMEGSRSALERVLAADPEHAKANYLMGIILAASDPDKAKEHLEKFIALAPDDPDAATAREMLEYL